MKIGIATGDYCEVEGHGKLRVKFRAGIITLKSGKHVDMARTP